MKLLTSLLTATLLAGSTVMLPAQAQSAGDYIATGARTATVFDPPSNVRDAPNGNIICTITTRRQITVYRYTDDSYQWLSTDACGSNRYGVIHISQIRF